MTRAKLLVTICQIEWSRSLEYAFVKSEKNLGSNFVKSWTKKITKENGDFSETESTSNLKI
jgi:hypothetical protein